MNKPKTVRSELTPRDIQVARWIARGKERSEVASILGVSKPAIDRHLAKMKRATGADNTTQAMAVLMSVGLLTPADVVEGSDRDRRTFAATIAPGITVSPKVAARDVAAYLRGRQVSSPVDDAERHFNDVIDRMANEWSAH